MKSVVIYDSAYGNTAEVATIINDSLEKFGESSKFLVAEAPGDVSGYDLVIIGSPTQGGTYTVSMKAYLDTVDGLDGKPVAVFDTRLDKQAHGRWLKILMSTIGFAAEKIAKTVTQKGARVVGKPAGFIVGDKEGPLLESEKTRAAVWTAGIASNTAKGELR